jgi:hypothetical protein
MKKDLTRKTCLRLALRAGLIVALALPLFFQPDASAQSPSEAQIINDFAALEKFIAGQRSLTAEQRSSLQEKQGAAKAGFAAGQPCSAAASLSDFAAQSQQLRQGDLASLAEDLQNRGWQLRAAILLSLPRDRSCDNAPRFQQEPRIEKTASDNRHLQGRVSFGEMMLQTMKEGGELFTKLRIPGVHSEIGETGAPAVPVFSRLIAVPQGATARVNFNTGPARTIKLNLYPFQIPRTTGFKPLRNGFQPVPPPPFVKNAKAYARDAFAPTPICKVSPAGKARDLEMFRLTCTTGQYNPVTDELRLFDSIDFDVQFQGGNGYFLTRKAMSPFESTQIYSDSVLNGDILNKYPKPDEGPSTCVGEELLILTHPKFLLAAQELAKWKTDKGIVTSVFNVNDGGGNLGPDTKEEIDAFIESRYQKCQTRPSYVLLLGDVEYVPTFHVVSELSANTGTDHPYALLTDNDQLGVPDFAVGRISVDTLEEANIVVNKTIKYESKPPFNPAFYKKPMMATQFECCQMDLDEKGKDIMIPMRHVEFWAIRLASPYNVDPYEVDRFYVKTVEPNYKAVAGEGVARRYYDGVSLPLHLQEENGFVWKFPGDQQPFADAINEGRFLVNYNGHGFPYGLSTPDFDNFFDGNLLHNGELLPVFFSVSCSTAMFDNEDANGEDLANPSYPTLGEWFLMNNNGGAVGFLGPTRTTYVDTAEAFMDGLFRAIWPDPSNGNLPTNRLGEIFNYGKLYLWGRVTADPDEWDSPMDAFYQFTLLGDPTLEMWTHDPHNFKLNLDFEYKVFDQFLQINYAVEGATITAYQATPNGVVPVGRGEVSNGVATLPFVNQPAAGASLQFAAGLRNSVSVKLAK